MIVRRLVDGVDERLDGTSFIKRNLRKVFPDHWSFMLGELALYSFALLLLTGTFLSLFFVASPAETVYRGPYAPLQGSRGLSRLRIGVAHLLRGAGGARDASDAPLVGAGVRRRDDGPPRARLLHRRLPQASRAQLDHRGDAARARHRRRVHRVLAPRRPALRHGVAHHLLGRALDPGDRHLARLPVLRGRVPVG